MGAVESHGTAAKGPDVENRSTALDPDVTSEKVAEGPDGSENAPEGPEVTSYFGSQTYYEGDLLQDQRYQHDKDLETMTVTLPDGDKITMWAYAIDVRACDDPVKELPKRGFDKTDDYVVFHYTDEEGFRKITSSRTVWASMSPQIDSNFGFGVYSSCKAPHHWRSKQEIFINNFFPSRKDWQQRKHLDFTEWPSLEALKFNKQELSDRELDELLNTPFGQAVLKKWEPTRKCDFCVPIVCDYHCAQDVMRQDTFASNMGDGKTRRAGYNKFAEEEPKWRDVWTVVIFEKRELSQKGNWHFRMCNASQPPELILQTQQRRRAKQHQENSPPADFDTNPPAHEPLEVSSLQDAVDATDGTVAAYIPVEIPRDVEGATAEQRQKRLRGLGAAPKFTAKRKRSSEAKPKAKTNAKATAAKSKSKTEPEGTADNKEETASGHGKSDLMKNKRNRVVTKMRNAAGKKAYKNISAWTTATLKARTELGIKGFCAMGGETAQGKALYAKAKAIYAAKQAASPAKPKSRRKRDEVARKMHCVAKAYCKGWRKATVEKKSKEECAIAAAEARRQWIIEFGPRDHPLIKKYLVKFGEVIALSPSSSSDLATVKAG